MLTRLADGGGAAEKLHSVDGELVAHAAAQLRGDIFDAECAGAVLVSLRCL